MSNICNKCESPINFHGSIDGWLHVDDKSPGANMCKRNGSMPQFSSEPEWEWTLSISRNARAYLRFTGDMRAKDFGTLLSYINDLRKVYADKEAEEGK